MESRRPTWSADQGWTISPDPVVDIGVVDGPAAYQLHRASSAVRLTDGRIVVANGGTNELRFFDSAGTHLFSVGRVGEGPGEFRDLQHVWGLPGDSLLAYDFMPSRLSVFSPSGEFVRSFSIAAPDGRQVIIRGPLTDGSVIVAGAQIWGAPGATSGVVRDSVPYFRFDATGTLIDTLGFFSSNETYRVVTGEDWRLTSPPFPRAPVSAIAGDRFYFGPADAYEIRIHDASGAVERILRMPNVRRPVTEDDVVRFRRRQLARAEREGTRPRMERMLRDMPYPEAMPPYERILVDMEGNLWVADYRVVEGESSSWNVFAPDGRLLGAVAMPARFEAVQIGADFVLGSWVDELGVEHIRMYRLLKGS